MIQRKQPIKNISKKALSIKHFATIFFDVSYTRILLEILIHTPGKNFLESAKM